MAKELKGNAIIGQGGGPTSVINRSLSGFVDRFIHYSDSNFKGIVYGALNGSRGMRDWNVIALNDIDKYSWKRIRRTPGAFLGSTRDKPDEEYCARIFENFKKNNVRYFFYIGGNDSADTAEIIRKMSVREQYEVLVFHIAKTVDNDLVKGDHMPGFPSAAKHLIYTIADLISDAASLPGIIVVESMGRDAGYLTASGALINDVISGVKIDPLVYVPEVRIELDTIAEHALERYGNQGIAVVVYSEGIKNNEGKRHKDLLEKLEKDPRGQVRLSASPVLISELQRRIKEKGDVRIIPHMMGYPQRADARTISEVDKHESYHLGAFAVKLALEDNISSGSVGIEAIRDPYQESYVRFELADVAQKARTLDPKFLYNGRINVLEYRNYLRPLLGSLDHENEINPRLLKHS